VFKFFKTLQKNKGDDKLKDVAERIVALEESNLKLLKEVQSLSDLLQKTIQNLYTISSVNVQLTSDMQTIYDLLTQTAGSMLEHEDQDIHDRYGMWYCGNDDDDLPN